jgi:phosphoglycolate phosphatase
VAETLEKLKKGGLRLAVCSNKPIAFTRELLDYLGIAGRFDVVIGPEDAPRLKPAPDMLRAALKTLGVTPAQALYVGDMVVDIQTARAAGVPVCVVPTGSDDAAALRGAQPDRLLARFRDVAAVLDANASPSGDSAKPAPPSQPGTDDAP